jgi:hypothetical protein
MLHTRRAIGTVAYLGGLPAVLEPFCWAWSQMVQYNAEYMTNRPDLEYVHYDRATASFHSFARNSLVERFLGDWLIQMDTDHCPDPDIAVRLVKTADWAQVDVLTAIYRHRAEPGPPVLYQWDEENKFLHPIASWDKSFRVMRIGASGAGCLFVRRHVFEKVVRAFRCAPFDILDLYGEDHSFFKRLRELDIPAYAAVNIESPHMRWGPFGLDDYEMPEVKPAQQIPAGGFR